MSIVSLIQKKWSSLSKAKKIATAVGVGVILVVALRGGQAPTQEEQERAVPSVSLLSIAEATTDTSRVKGNGEVESLAQVELRSEVSARVVSVPVKIGQDVVAGQLLAAFDASDLIARLEQAQADLASAEAGVESSRAGLAAQESQLLDIRNGGRPEEVAIQEAAVEAAANSLADAQLAAKTLLETIIPSVEATLYIDIDPLFINPNSSAPELVFGTVISNKRTTVEGRRQQIPAKLSTWNAGVDALDPTNNDAVVAELNASEEILVFLQEFLEALTEAIVDNNTLSLSVESTYTATVAGARNTIAGHIASVRAQKQSIVAKQIAVKQANEQLLLVRQGATGEQVASQEAVVNQAMSSLTIQEAAVARARGVVRGINAELAKRSIRTPISGTVAVLPVRVGELVSPGAVAASIVNTTGLQVKAFVDSSAATSFTVGAPVVVGKDIAGVVSTISPSIDPVTRKVEVGVAIEDQNAPLIVGQFVDISIQKAEDASNAVLLPLRAINVSTDGSTVYTVGDDNTVVAVSVTLGRVVGESVEVLSGLTDVTSVISSVRGLNEGDEVAIR